MPSVLHALFVAWQNPTTQRFYPVGRLAQIEGEGGEDCFEFVYIRGASLADGFAAERPKVEAAGIAKKNGMPLFYRVFVSGQFLVAPLWYPQWHPLWHPKKLRATASKIVNDEALASQGSEDLSRRP